MTALIRSKGLRNAQGIIARYARGQDCESCRRLIESILGSRVEQFFFTTPGGRRAVEELQAGQADRFGSETLTALDWVDSLSLRYEALRTPRPLTLAVTGGDPELCPIAVGTKADLWIEVAPTHCTLHLRIADGEFPQILIAGSVLDVVRCLDRCLAYYLLTARPAEPWWEWSAELEGRGLDHLREVLLSDRLGICSDLDDLL